MLPHYIITAKRNNGYLDPCKNELNSLFSIKKHIKVLIGLGLFLLTSNNCYSQTNVPNSQINFKNIGRAEGLPRDWVYSVSQDSTGHMWIASLNGLNRYNGEEFKVYPVGMTSTTDNIINDQKVYTDRSGKIWSLVGDVPIKLYNKEKDSFEIIPTIPNAKCMIHSLDGSYYIGTVGKGLYRIIPKERDTTQLINSQQIPQQIYKIKEHKGKIYAITSEGIIGIEDSNLKWLVHDKKDDTIFSALEASNKLGIWIGTKRNGLYKMDENNSLKLFEGFKNQILPKNLDIIDLKIDSDLTLWVSTFENGVYLIDFHKENIVHLKNEKYNKNSLLSNKIQMIYEDRTKGIWVANSKGVSLYDPYLFKFGRLTQNELPYDLTMSTVTEIEQDSIGNIWMGTSESGLFKIDKSTGIINYTEQNSNLTSNGIVGMEIINELLWISNIDSEVQVFLLNDKKKPKSIEKYDIKPYVVESLKADSDNNIWLYIPNKGLIKSAWLNQLNKKEAFDLKNQFTISSKKIYDYKEGVNKKIWVLSAEGLFYYDLNNSNTYSFDLELNPYSKIYPFMDNTLWIWNHNSGLLNFDPVKNQILSNFKYTPEFTVQSINYYKDWFWLGTSQGIVKINKDTGEMIKFNDPLSLQSLEFTFANHLDKENHVLYMGGKEGINWFRPENIVKNPYPAETVLTSINLYENPVDTVSTKNFEYDQNSFTFKISGLQFSSPENGSFKYRLINYQEKWLENNNNSIIKFSNLPPGEYEFQAISSNYDNVWDPTPVKYGFSIFPPWYLSKFAWIGYFIAFFALLYWIYYYFQSRWEIQSKLRWKHQESERLKELDNFKNELYENISHELRSPLTLLLGPIERQLQNSQNSENLQKDLKLISRNTERLIRLVDQIYDLARLETGNWKVCVEEIHPVPFFKQIFALYEHEAKNKNIAFKVKIEKMESVWLDLDVLEKIVTNLLSNAIKYTETGGEIICKVKSEEEKLIIEVLNNCATLNASELSKIFERYYQTKKTNLGSGIGLSLIKELVSLSEGKIEATLLNDKLLKFEVEIPFAIEPNTFDQIDNRLSKKNKETFSITKVTSKKSITKNYAKPVLLVVEDDKEIRAFIKSLFDESFKIIESDNGQQGHDLATEFIPDIILSDDMMPLMDGVVMIKKLKSNELTSHIPILLITAKADKKSKISGLKSGADDYIIKPFNIQTLKLKVDNLIQLQKNLKTKFSSTNFPIQIDYKDLEERFLNRVVKVLDENIQNSQLTSNELAAKMNVSRTQLHRKLKALTGKTATEFIRQKRTHHAKKLLRNTNLSIKEIGYKVGFNSPSYFITSFKREFNMTPANFREKNEPH